MICRKMPQRAQPRQSAFGLHGQIAININHDGRADDENPTKHRSDTDRRMRALSAIGEPPLAAGPSSLRSAWVCTSKARPSWVSRPRRAMGPSRSSAMRSNMTISTLVERRAPAVGGRSMWVLGGASRRFAVGASEQPVTIRAIGNAICAVTAKRPHLADRSAAKTVAVRTENDPSHRWEQFLPGADRKVSQRLAAACRAAALQSV